MATKPLGFFRRKAKKFVVKTEKFGVKKEKSGAKAEKFDVPVLKSFSMKDATLPHSHEYADDMLLRTLARKYVWWKTPEEALKMPERVIAQVMNIGDYDDVCLG